MKRVRENQQERHDDLGLERSIAIANYLLMLSHGTTTASTCQTSRVFECKTCSRQFSSFQALGGHRASHKKPKHLSPPPSGDGSHEGAAEGGGAKVATAKTHECTICGLEFGVGQALGGHMRRHRANLPFVGLPLLSINNKNKNNNLGGNYGYNLGNNRVSLDLNLTPLENGLLEIKTFSSVYS